MWNCMEFIRNWYKTLGTSPPSASIHWESKSTAWQFVLLKFKITGSPYGNESTSVIVTYGTLYNPLGSSLKHLEYPLPQTPSTGNQNPGLDCLFSPKVQSLGLQLGIRVVLSQFHLEVVGIHDKLLWNIWNTPCLRCHALKIKVHVLTVFSLSKYNHWECRWESE